jgi:hypothetical protein
VGALVAFLGRARRGVRVFLGRARRGVRVFLGRVVDAAGAIVRATRSMLAGRRFRAVLADRRVRAVLADRRVRSAVVTGLIVGAIIVVLGLLVAAFNARDGRTVGSGGPDAPAVTAVSPVISFRPPAADALDAEDRVRPVGIRSLEFGFEAAVVRESTVPECATHDPERERAIWFDPDASGDGGDLVAVAPGEHGVAVILGGADEAVAGAPLRGIGLAREGSFLEVARSNGTVLGWKIVDVVRSPAGSGLPTSVLTEVDEQRLLLVGCGATVGDEVVDLYVLALRGR